MKSQVSIQINWIFVLIAGFLILLFFIGIVYRQRSVSETRLALGIATDIETLLTGAGVAAGTVNLLDKPDIDLNVGCDDEPWFGVDWENTGVQKELPRQIVFGPDTIKGTKLLTWALSFDAPFKVSNVLMLTSPELRYIFVNPQSEFAQELYEDFPDEAFKEIVTDVDSVQDLGNYKVRLVFFDENAVLPSSLLDADVSAVSVVGDKVSFFEKVGSRFELQGESIFLSDSMVHGAVFSEDLSLFDCSLGKGLDRLSIVSDIYALREDQLEEYFVSGEDPRNCADFFNDYEDSFIASMHRNVDTCRANSATCPAEIELARRRIQDIRTRNEVLRTSACPTLY